MDGHYRSRQGDLTSESLDRARDTYLSYEETAERLVRLLIEGAELRHRPFWSSEEISNRRRV